MPLDEVAGSLFYCERMIFTIYITIKRLGRGGELAKTKESENKYYSRQNSKYKGETVG